MHTVLLVPALLFPCCLFGQKHPPAVPPHVIVDDGSFERQDLHKWTEVKTADLWHAPLSMFEGNVPAAADGAWFYGLRLNGPPNLNWQEYIYQSLDSGELQAGVMYKVTFNYTFCDASSVTSDDFGVGFFSDPDFANGTVAKLEAAVAQVRQPEGELFTNITKWLPFTGFYTATGNETHFALGAFRTDADLTLVPFPHDYPDQYAHAILFIDDVKITACAPLPKPLDEETLFCGAAPYTLDASVNGGIYSWNDGSSEATLDVDAAGTYWVDIIYDGCTRRDSTQVRMFAPSSDLGPDRMLCSRNDFPLLLTVDAAKSQTVLWSDGSTAKQHAVEEAGTYTVVKSEGACTWSDTITIRVFDEYLLAYPNPTSETLNIPGGDEVKVTSIATTDGKMLREGPFLPSDLDGLIPRLAPATYLLTLEGYGCRSTLKVEVKR